ncbi:MAG: FAA hydrolase family protein [Rhodocyclaceae bacterium]|nr:MAG: FAA hydrolase family protein [Rhodocyclaceae bacterium]
MTQYAFAPAETPSVAIKGSSARFPVRRIFCVGRNYAAHAAEMGRPVDKATSEPFYFTKSPDTVLPSGSKMTYPPGTKNFHYEMELVVAIGAPIFRATEADAEKVIFGYACGLDMTRRDLQLVAREQGRPWDLGKDVEQSAAISEIVPYAELGMLSKGEIALSVNGDTKQKSDLSYLIWNIPELIAHLSKFYHLQPGDLIYTGTPEGVGPVVAGDKILGHIDKVGKIELEITSAE